jgi:hypothetical protein
MKGAACWCLQAGTQPRGACHEQPRRGAPTWSDGVTKIVDSFALSLSDQPRTGRVESRALTLGLNGDGTCVAV